MWTLMSSVPASAQETFEDVRQTLQAYEQAWSRHDAGYLRAMIERGYERSEWESLNGRLLDAQTALASGVAVRYRLDGSILERVGLTYHFWKTGDGWKIFVSATHAPENVLRFQ
jgi:hypothetical protein